MTPQQLDLLNAEIKAKFERARAADSPEERTDGGRGSVPEEEPGEE